KIFCRGGRYPPDHQIKLALPQQAAQCRRVAFGDMEFNTRTTVGEARNDGGDHLVDERSGAAKPQLSERRGGKENQRLNATPQFIEHDRSAIDEGMAVGGRFDALRVAIEETDSERVFEVGYRFRDNGLRDRKAFRRPDHASALRDGEKNVKIAQLDT